MAQNSAAVRSVVVPLERDLLLLPGSVVAEIVPYKQPAPPPPGAPGWLLGILDWREQRIPLVALEAFIGGQAVATGERARIAVLKVLGDAAGFTFYGVVASRIPRLMTVRAEAVARSPSAGAQRPGVEVEARVEGETMFIPDLDTIEAALRSALQA